MLNEKSNKANSFQGSHQQPPSVNPTPQNLPSANFLQQEGSSIPFKSNPETYLDPKPYKSAQQWSERMTTGNRADNVNVDFDCHPAPPPPTAGVERWKATLSSQPSLRREDDSLWFMQTCDASDVVADSSTSCRTLIINASETGSEDSISADHIFSPTCFFATKHLKCPGCLDEVNMNEIGLKNDWRCGQLWCLGCLRCRHCRLSIATEANGSVYDVDNNRLFCDACAYGQDIPNQTRCHEPNKVEKGQRGSGYVDKLYYIDGKPIAMTAVR